MPTASGPASKPTASPDGEAGISRPRLPPARIVPGAISRASRPTSREPQALPAERTTPTNIRAARGLRTRSHATLNPAFPQQYHQQEYAHREAAHPRPMAEVPAPRSGSAAGPTGAQRHLPQQNSGLGTEQKPADSARQGGGEGLEPRGPLAQGHDHDRRHAAQHQDHDHDHARRRRARVHRDRVGRSRRRVRRTRRALHGAGRAGRAR